MRILEVEERNSDLISKLIAVWEASVRATHLFLSDSEILSIKEYVPQAAGTRTRKAAASIWNQQLQGKQTDSE